MRIDGDKYSCLETNAGSLSLEVKVTDLRFTLKLVKTLPVFIHSKILYTTLFNIVCKVGLFIEQTNFYQ